MSGFDRRRVTRRDRDEIDGVTWIVDPLPPFSVDDDKKLCGDLSPDFFYVDPHEKNPETGHSMHAQIRQVRYLCRGCPERVKCCALALWHNDPYGMWGGTTASDRRLLLKKIGGQEALQMRDDPVAVVRPLYKHYVEQKVRRA